MNRFSTALALITLTAAGAQNMPSQSAPPAGTTPPPTYPSSTAPSESQSRADTSSSDTKAAQKQQIKDCMAQQKANNSTMSKHELKKYCKNQVQSTPPSSTPHD
jgi:Spy/CpxP family protein refolding chaperone